MKTKNQGLKPKANLSRRNTYLALYLAVYLVYPAPFMSGSA